MKNIILWILGVILAFAVVAKAEEIDFASIPTGEYALVGDFLIGLRHYAVDFIPRLYSRQMIDGIADDKRPVSISGREMEFVSSHSSTAIADSLNPFNPGKIILSELIYLPGMKIWRRGRDVPLEIKIVSWGQKVSILSPRENLKPGARYALFYGNSLNFHGTTIPLCDDLRAGAYYFIVSDSAGQ